MLPNRYRGRYSLFILLSLLVHFTGVVVVFWVSDEEQLQKTDKTVIVTLKQKEEPKKEEPKKEEPKKEEPKKEEPKKEEPKKEEPKKEEPKKEEPKKEEPKKEEPKKEEPKKEEPKKEEPKKEEPKKEEPKKEEPKKQEPKKQEPKKQEPKKQEPKKQEPKKQEPKKQEPKKQEPKKQEPKKQEPKKQEPKKQEPKKQEPKKPEPKKEEPKKQEAKKQKPKKTEAKKQQTKDVQNNITQAVKKEVKEKKGADTLVKINDSLFINQMDLQSPDQKSSKTLREAFFEESAEKTSKKIVDEISENVSGINSLNGLKMLDDDELSTSYVETKNVSRNILKYNSQRFSKLLQDEEKREELFNSLSNAVKSDENETKDKKKLSEEQLITRKQYLIEGANSIIKNIDPPAYDGGKYYGEVSILVSLKGEFLKLNLKSSGHDELDLSVLRAIRKTKYMNMPDDILMSLSLRSVSFWFNEETMSGYPVISK